MVYYYIFLNKKISKNLITFVADSASFLYIPSVVHKNRMGRLMAPPNPTKGVFHLAGAFFEIALNTILCGGSRGDVRLPWMIWMGYQL